MLYLPDLFPPCDYGHHIKINHSLMVKQCQNTALVPDAVNHKWRWKTGYMITHEVESNSLLSTKGSDSFFLSAFLCNIFAIACV